MLECINAACSGELQVLQRGFAECRGLLQVLQRVGAACSGALSHGQSIHFQYFPPVARVYRFFKKHSPGGGEPGAIPTRKNTAIVMSQNITPEGCDPLMAFAEGGAELSASPTQGVN